MAAKRRSRPWRCAARSCGTSAKRSQRIPPSGAGVAAYLDAALKRVRDSLPMVESHKAAILAALSITDELFQARRGDREAADRLSSMANDLARLLPPAKRGSRAAS